MKNMLACAVPRILVSEDSPINESEYCDLSADIVHCSGAITDATYRPISAGHLDSVYISALQNKIDELKETTGNRDVSNGRLLRRSYRPPPQLPQCRKREAGLTVIRAKHHTALSASCA